MKLLLLAQTISPKSPIPNTIKNFLQLDPKIWTQMGELFQECSKKLNEKLACNNWMTDIYLGEIIGIDEISPPEIRILIRPKYIRTSRVTRNGQFVGTMDNERIAEKPRDPDVYSEKRGEKDYSSIRGHKREQKPTANLEFGDWRLLEPLC